MSDYLIHRRISLQPHHRPKGNTIHALGTVDVNGQLARGAELPAPQSLMIVQMLPHNGYYLLYLDSNGNELTDTWHDSLETALGQATWEFNVEPDEWEAF